MLELFPFGRRMFALRTAAAAERGAGGTASPALLCSLRDILVGKANPDATARPSPAPAPAWTTFWCTAIRGWCRSRPSFPPMAEIADMLVYTGYVVERPSRPRARRRPTGDGEVIVSVGGGAVGLALLRAALAAQPLCRLADRPWRLITGPNLAEEAFAELAWAPPPGVIVERWIRICRRCCRLHPIGVAGRLQHGDGRADGRRPRRAGAVRRCRETADSSGAGARRARAGGDGRPGGAFCRNSRLRHRPGVDADAASVDIDC